MSTRNFFPTTNSKPTPILTNRQCCQISHEFLRTSYFVSSSKKIKILARSVLRFSLLQLVSFLTSVKTLICFYARSSQLKKVSYPWKCHFRKKSFEMSLKFSSSRMVYKNRNTRSTSNDFFLLKHNYSKFSVLWYKPFYFLQQK